MTIKITKPIQGFIVESQKQDVIQNGSHIFCGHCGIKIGRMNKSLKFPFQFSDLEQSLEDTSIFVTRNYVTHVPCQHTISFASGNIRFTTLSNYRKWFKEDEK